MTTGSWSYGNRGPGPIYAQKSWTGTDGKTEAWAGGIRSKWNDFEMYHVRTKCGAPLGSPIGVIPNNSLSNMRIITGYGANDDLRLLNKLAENVRGHSFDLGINIAEAKRTYGTILSNVRSIGSALLDLKRGNFSNALRHLGSNQLKGPRGHLNRLVTRDLAGRWLETQYAFMPLIGQSWEAAKALEAATGPRVLRFFTSSRSKAYEWDNSDNPMSYKSMVKMKYSKKLTAELSEDLSLNRSLGLTNPAAIAWEVVPYSFVVDWFIPIGSYLSAWGVIPALVGRFMTTERGMMEGCRVSAGSVPAWYPMFYQGAFRSERIFATKRVTSSSLSVPLPQFNKPPSALSPRRLLSAVALIHQRLR